MKDNASFIIVVLLSFTLGCANRLVFNSNSPYSYMDIPTYPLILSIYPGDGEYDVSTSTQITAAFSRDIDPCTIGDSSFILADSDYVPVDGTYAFPDAKTVAFTPNAQLMNLTEYNVLLTKDILDMDGNSLQSEKIWYFTTISSGTVPDPVITPVSGAYEGPQQVAITCLDPEATIRFTTDGSDPTPLNGTRYTARFSVSASTLQPVKAMAYRAGFIDSTIAAASYTIQAFMPAIDPPPGIYSIDPLVSLATQTPGANIKYTLDLSDPATSVTATGYTGPFAVSGPGTVTVRAVALSPDLLLMANSPVLTAVYVINYTKVAPPVFDPPPGTYTADVPMTFASPTAGTLILYTTDGSDPHVGGIPGGASVTLTVSDSMTIKAYAYDGAALMADSDVITGPYIIAPTILDMVPNKGSNTQVVFVTITGTHFKPGVTVQLTRNVLPPIPTATLTLVNSQTITCTFDLTGRSKGKWTLVVTNDDSGTALKNEFRIY